MAGVYGVVRSRPPVRRFCVGLGEGCGVPGIAENRSLIPPTFYHDVSQSRGMSNPDGHELDDETRLEILLAEYQQAGEEVRLRDQLLHNSYYLMVFAFGVFAVGAIQLWSRNPVGAVLLLVIAGGVFLFLAVVIHALSSLRQSACSRRRRVEELVDQYEPEILQIQRNAVNKRLPGNEDEPRELTGLEGISTKWISYVSAFLSAGLFILAVLVMRPV